MYICISHNSLNIYTMKKLFLLLLLAIASVSATIAQEVQITKDGVDYTNGTYNCWFDITDYTGNLPYSLSGFEVKNIGPSSKTLRMTRTEISVVDSTENYFCWESCYSPQTNISLGNVILNSNQSFLNMYLDYKPKGHYGITTIRYRIENIADTTDGASILVHFSATPTSVKDLTPVAKLNSLFPNPAKNSITVNYTLNPSQSNLEIRNVLGQIQKNVMLTAGSKSVNLNVDDMPSGIYFITLKSNGNVIDTQRLIVN